MATQKSVEPTQVLGWREVTLGECAELIRDSVSPFDMGDALYLGLEHIGEGTLSLLERGTAADVTSTKSQFQRGDILFGKLRPYFRKVIRAPADGLCSTDIWVVRSKVGVNQGYLYYCIASQQFVDFVTSGSEGTRMPRAIWEYASRYRFSLPSLPEQRAIAHILGTLDNKIELNRRMNETLEAMAQALFKSWFVDFDPVHVKMEGQWQRGESLPGLPADLNDLFPDRIVDSDLGEIPEGWEFGTVSQLAERIQNGGTPKRSEPTYWDTKDIPWLTSSEVRQSFVLNTQNYISRLGLEQSSANIIPARSILVALYGATAGQVSMNIYPLTTNQAVSAIIPSDGNRYFCLVSLKSQVGELGNRAVGSAQQNISKKAVESTNVVLPSIELRLNFDIMVKGLFERIYRNLEESHALIAQRDALLPRLVSGQLKLESV